MKFCQKGSSVICRELALFGWSQQSLRAVGCQGHENDPCEDATNSLLVLGSQGPTLDEAAYKEFLCPVYLGRTGGSHWHSEWPQQSSVVLGLGELFHCWHCFADAGKERWAGCWCALPGPGCTGGGFVLLGCVEMIFCRKASHHLRAPRRRCPLGKHSLFHMQGRRQPKACHYLAPQQVSVIQ